MNVYHSIVWIRKGQVEIVVCGRDSTGKQSWICGVVNTDGSGTCTVN